MYEVNKGSEQALRTYLSGRAWSCLAHLWSLLTRQRDTLLDLDTVSNGCPVFAQHYAGLQAVPVKRILGSEGRCDDFDRCFRLRRSHTEKRWLGIAMAWLNGVELPPVDLIQIGNVYFVRDGHHRVSVLRALGQIDIDATVTIWEMSGPPHWQQSVSRTVAPVTEQPGLVTYARS